jgi:23S rRNA pseudouridine1911/1915/1917 synthase
MMAERTRESWAEHRIGAGEAGRSVQDVLIQILGISRRRIQKLTRSRGIRVNGRPTFLARRVREGDLVSCRISDRERASLPAEPIPLDILFEDSDVLVLNKPAGMLVHPTSGQTGTLVHGVAHHLRKRGERARPHAVHRLDRATTGAVLVATSAVVHQQLDRELRDGRIEREYLALVEGRLLAESGTIEAPIGPHPTHRELRAAGVAEGDPAITSFDVVERFADGTFVRVRLETGRTHQIRAHFAYAGHPVVGDVRYGARRAPLRRQALHAARLTFRHLLLSNAYGIARIPPCVSRYRAGPLPGLGKSAERSTPRQIREGGGWVGVPTVSRAR